MKWQTVLRVIVGIMFIGLGIYMFFNPLATLVSVSILLGAGILAAGIFRVISYATERGRYPSSGWLLAEGIIDILIGVLLLLNIGATAAALPFVLGIWGVFVGISWLLLALNAKKAGFYKWKKIFTASIITVILGILIMFVPALGAVYIVVSMAVLMVYYGVVIISESLDKPAGA